jgi:hypothetical protein
VREGSSSPENFRATSCAGGYTKELVYSIPTEVLKKQVENATTTICNNRGMLERVEESFRRCLHYCIDNNGGHFEHFV